MLISCLVFNILKIHHSNNTVQMSNKKIINNWENKLEDLLQYTDKEIVNSLHEMEALGYNIDEKFGKLFGRIVKNRLSESYDKFNIGLVMSSQNTVRRPSTQRSTTQRPSTSRSTPQRRSTSSVNGTRPKSPNRKPSRWDIRLEEQRKLITQISIDGIPPHNGEDVQSLFLQLCTKIHFDISHENLNNVHRDTNQGIIVDFKTISFKRNMLRAWRQALSSSTTFFDREFSLNERPGRISITDAKTQYYGMLYKIVQYAANDWTFDNCEMCADGLEITWDHGHKKAVVSSISELHNLINRYSKR